MAIKKTFAGVTINKPGWGSTNVVYQTCQVCSRAEYPTEVRCSALGAVSFAYCGACITYAAEPKEMLKAMIEDLGGLDACAPWVLDISYYEDGRYKFSPELFKA